MPGHDIAKEVFKNQQQYLKYTCLSCNRLLRNAVQSALCGHWFCETCIAQLLKTSNPICPNCKENLKEGEDGEVSPGYFPDKFVRRDIDALEMVCLYQKEGCDWEGTFAKLQGHLTDCEYSICGACQQRLSVIPSEHECKLKAGGVFFCPLSKLGCRAGKFENRQALEAHNKDAELSHNELIAAVITKLETTMVSNTQGVTPHYPVVEADGGCVGSKDPRLDSGFESGLVSGGSGLVSGGSGQFGVKVTDDIERDRVVRKSPRTSSHASRIGTLDASHSMSLHAQLQGDPVGKVNHELESVRRELKIKDEEIAALRTMVNKLERTQRSKNADFEDRDFRLSLIENSNYDGTMVWKIPQFSQRMTDAQSGKYTSIFSLPFYTGRYGYKMCLRLYILGDGIGKGGYMSLFFVLMKGEFDNILQWPFTHKVTFKLLNQGNGRDIVDTFQPDPMSTSFRKPKSDMNIASGCPRFVSHEDLKSGGFTMDDTVFIKCMVETNTIKHP